MAKAHLTGVKVDTPCRPGIRVAEQPLLIACRCQAQGFRQGLVMFNPQGCLVGQQIVLQQIHGAQGGVTVSIKFRDPPQGPAGAKMVHVATQHQGGQLLPGSRPAPDAPGYAPVG